MKGRSLLAMSFACLLLAPASVAFAQDEEEESEEEGASEEGASEEGASEEGASEEGASEEGASEEAPAAGGRWPRSVIARPLTLPKGLIRVGGSVPFTNKFKSIGLGINGGYGVSDDLEVNATYLLSLKEFNAAGVLGADAGYKIIRGGMGGKLEVIARAGTGFNLDSSKLTAIGAGAQVQYNISDKLAIVSSGANLSVALTEVIVPPATTGVKPITLAVPVGVGYQATPELYAELTTTLATFNISDSANAFIFGDNLPLTLTTTYNAMPNLDVYAAVIFGDLINASDAINLTIGAQYYMGSL